MRFFNRTPTGKLLNLASKDMDTIDLIYPQQMGIILFCGSQLIVICFSVVLHCIFIIFLVLFLFFCLFRYINFYISVSQDLKRMELASYSPLISRIIEVYNGILVLRHSKAVKRQKKIFGDLVNDTATMFMGQARVTVYTQLLCEGTTNLFITSVFIILVALSFQREVITKSQLTFLSANLNWIFVIPSFINVLLIYYSFFCQSMISAERIFTLVPEESDDIDWKAHKPENLPIKGRIQLRNVSFKYTKDSALVLKNINLDIEPGQKVGIVGQTGSGKSSLMLAITRMIPIDAESALPQSNPTAIAHEKNKKKTGTILIDGKDFEKIDERDLRHTFGIINQESFIIEGSLKENMDPLHQFTHKELTELVFSMGILSLNTISLLLNKELDESDPMSNLTNEDIHKIMEMHIKEQGNNISVGQKQLICIARLVLKKPKIVFIDEGTANIDSEKDGVIQELIRETLPNSTIISIAHRVDTLQGYDKIVVLDHGKIVEQGSPNDLMNLKGQFYKLATAKKNNAIQSK